MALGDGSLRCECFVAIGGEADIARVPPACRCEAIDPSRSRQCRGFHSIPSRPFSLRRMRINTLALVARLPTMHGTRTYGEAGGLMSYGARRAAGYVDKPLRGARPSIAPTAAPRPHPNAPPKIAPAAPPRLAPPSGSCA